MYAKAKTMPNSMLANPKETKRVLDSFNLSAKYKFGQNFLVDDNIIGRILEFANITEQDIPVLEVGPGIGTLTVAMLQKAPVISIEFDEDMAHVLQETTGDYSERFALIQKDALKLQREDIENAISRLNDMGCNGAASFPKKLVANLPYQIAATLILDYFERFEFLEEMIVMVQREVADRICAQLGTKDYGAYSIKLRMHAKMLDRFQVAPTCFYPAPRVESSVIHLCRDCASSDKNLVRAASKIADAAFAQRRKTIRNSLSTSFDKQLIDELLSSCNIAPNVRGEALNIQDYLNLGKEFLKLTSQH